MWSLFYSVRVYMSRNLNFLKITVCLKYFVSDRRLLSFCVFVFYVCFMLWIWCHFKRLKPAITRSYIKQFVWYNLYDSQSAFSFSLRLHFDPSCSHRHFNPHALSMWHTHCLSYTSSSVFFLNPAVFYAEMNDFKECISF